MSNNHGVRVLDLSEPDVIDVLTVDHHEALALVEQILSPVVTKDRRDLTDMLIAELVRHSVAEEMFVYPSMRLNLPNGNDVIDHDIEEHKELEVVMKHLEASDPGTAEFDALMRSLKATLVDHIRDEEKEQFPLMREHLDREELVRLAHLVQGAKKIAPTRPHPLSPNNLLFHTLVGPGVGLVDRLRDKLSGRVTS